MVPRPNGELRLEDPSDRRVIVPLPKADVRLVMVLPLEFVSVVKEPDPNGVVRVTVPSDHRVMVPEPKGCVTP